MPIDYKYRPPGRAKEMLSTAKLAYATKLVVILAIIKTYFPESNLLKYYETVANG